MSLRTSLGLFALALVLLGPVATDVSARRTRTASPGRLLLERAGRMMPGTFISFDHDTPRRLVVLHVWAHRVDGPWLYLESAPVDALDQPDYQAVWRLTQTGDGRVRRDVYRLPEDGAGVVWAWLRPASFRPLAPRDLDIERDCGVMLSDRGDHLSGRSLKAGCPGSLAPLVRNEVVLADGRLEVGEMVETPAEGGDEVRTWTFLRIRSQPPPR
ncbi:MAG: CpcT/CpeT family chromophore lyase [Acidobacteriota bacterium]